MKLLKAVENNVKLADLWEVKENKVRAKEVAINQLNIVHLNGNNAVINAGLFNGKVLAKKVAITVPFNANKVLIADIASALFAVENGTNLIADLA